MNKSQTVSLCAVLGLTCGLLVACGSSSDSPIVPDADASPTDTDGSTDAAMPPADTAAPPDAAGPTYHTLPFTSEPDAPVVAAIEYRCNTGDPQAPFIQAEVTVTDPQGFGDLRDYAEDHLGIFPTDPPSGTERSLDFQIMDDGSIAWGPLGEYGSVWGRFYDRFSDPAIYNAMCSATTWPMDVLVEDNSGHVTSGLVRGQRIDYKN